MSIVSPRTTRWRFTLTLIAVTQPLAAQRSPRPTIAEAPPGYTLRYETPHIILVGPEGAASPQQLQTFATQLGRYATGVREVLGATRAPDVRLVVVLDGPGSGSATTSVRVPHVNRSGVVFLYHYTPDRSDYLVSAAHEIVHAYRRAAGTPSLGFAEEGMAQAIALRVAPGTGFPRYGYPMHVVAGHLIARGVDLPMRDVWRRNREFTQRCAIHSYAQRESFFEYLSEHFGLEAIIDFVYDGRPNVPSGWIDAFGMTFDDLAADWRRTTLARFEADPTARDVAEEYRTTSPARFQSFCQ